MPTEITDPSETSSQSCPECGETLIIHEAILSIEAAAVGDRMIRIEKPEDVSPEPGSITICFGCAQLLTFDKNLKLRSLTSSEFRELPSDIKTVLHKARTVVRDIKAISRTNV